MADLIAPHGGLDAPVNCTVPADQVDAFQQEAQGLPQVPVSAADLSSVYRWGDGTLSPLEGPMTSAVYNKVLDESVIEVNGEKYAWTIPLSLPVTSELAGSLSAGQKVCRHGAQERCRHDPPAGWKNSGIATTQEPCVWQIRFDSCRSA